MKINDGIWKTLRQELVDLDLEFIGEDWLIVIETTEEELEAQEGLHVVEAIAAQHLHVAGALERLGAPLPAQGDKGQADDLDLGAGGEAAEKARLAGLGQRAQEHVGKHRPMPA